MKSLLFVCLQLVLYGMTVSVIREYFYNSQQTDITTAENYCRMNHGHLAHITTEEEFQKALLSSFLPSLPPSLAWIGLKRTAPHVNIWQWSNGKITNFTKWHSGEPDDQGTGEDCIVMDRNGWCDTSCVSGTFTSICSKNFTLVKEKKTWEEALQHCSTHYTDLAFVNTEQQLGYFSTHLNIENQTVSVWTGLRFLDGKWFWVNGVPMGSLVSLPQCPIHPYHCGSYTFNKNIWENRECNEKLHFLCYD